MFNKTDVPVDPISFIQRIDKCEQRRYQTVRTLRSPLTEVSQLIISEKLAEFMGASIELINLYNKLIRHGHNPIAFHVYLHPLEKAAADKSRHLATGIESEDDLPIKLIRLYLDVLGIEAIEANS
jgi:hypothetical protein